MFVQPILESSQTNFPCVPIEDVRADSAKCCGQCLAHNFIIHFLELLIASMPNLKLYCNDADHQFSIVSIQFCAVITSTEMKL